MSMQYMNVKCVIHDLIVMKTEGLRMIFLFAKIVWIEWKNNKA